MVKAGKTECGFTLMEVLIVICIVMILCSVATVSFSDWIAKYSIESQIYELYGRLQKTRVDALYKNRVHFITLRQDGYSVIADTFPDHLGNGNIDAEDSVIAQNISFSYRIDRASNITFDSRGLVPLSQIKTICVPSTVNPDADCIIIHRVRTNMGKIKNQNDACIAENCGPK